MAHGSARSLVLLFLYYSFVAAQAGKFALWVPTDGVDPTIVKTTSAALANFTVERINSTQLVDLKCNQYSVLVLVWAPLLPSVGGPPVAARCSLQEECVRGLAGTLSWYLTHGPGPNMTNCNGAWRNAAKDNVGPNSIHHQCPASAGSWGTSQKLFDCVPAVLQASKVSMVTELRRSRTQAFHFTFLNTHQINLFIA